MAMLISKFHKLVASKKVWTVFAVLISLAFVAVYTGGKGGRRQAGQNKTKEVAGKLYGKDVTQLEFGRAYQSAYLMLILRAQQPVNLSPQVVQLLRENAWQRLAILEKAREMGLVVTDEQVAEGIRQQAIFRNRQTGAFERQTYEMFFAQFLPSIDIGMSKKDFENMVRDNLLIEKASSMAMMGALATEEEIDHAFHIYADKLTVQYALLPRSLAPAPVVGEEDAKAYYGKYPNQFTYPDKVKVRYVEFAVADYTNQVEITDEMVSGVYENNKQYFAKPGTEEGALPEYKPLEEVRDEIVAEITSQTARQKAAGDAGQLVSKLSNQAASFDQLVQEMGKTIATTAPFALADTVRNIDPTAPFAREAFKLEDNPNHSYSDPVVGKDSVYVLVLHSRMASFLPGYDIVAKDALEAAKKAAGEKAYLEKAEAVHAQVEAALATGTTLAAALAPYGLAASSLEPFSADAPPTDDLGQQILRATVLFDTGTLANLIAAEDEYLLAYVSAREPAVRAAADPELIEQIRSSIMRDKATRLAAAWQDSVLKEAGLVDLLNKANDNS